MAWKADSAPEGITISLERRASPDTTGSFEVGGKKIIYNYFPALQNCQIKVDSFLVQEREITLYRNLRLRSVKVSKAKNYPAEYRIFQEFSTSGKQISTIRDDRLSAWFAGQKDVRDSLNLVVKEVHSPLNGKVLQIHCSEGKTVQKGALLCIVEAMKMENKIFAPRDGTIAQLNVTLNSSISAGDIIMTYV